MSHQLRLYWEGTLHVTMLNTHHLPIRQKSRALIKYYQTDVSLSN